MAGAGQIVCSVLRLGLAAVFLYAGFLKAVAPLEFLKDIESFRMLPGVLALALAFYLPFLEVACGAALCFKATEKAAARIVAALSGVFLLAILQAWVRGLDVRCGCFGAQDVAASYVWMVLRDAGLLAAAVFVGLWPRDVRPAGGPEDSREP